METQRIHKGDTKETQRRHKGDTQETHRRHRGDTKETQRRYKGDTKHDIKTDMQNVDHISGMSTIVLVCSPHF